MFIKGTVVNEQQCRQVISSFTPSLKKLLSYKVRTIAWLFSITFDPKFSAKFVCN